MKEKFRFKLGEVLTELNVTRNKLAVEAKIRPATILDLVSGDVKRIELKTLADILDTLNRIANDHEIKRAITINDLIEYIPDNDAKTASR